MEDYPRTLRDFERRFATEDACWEYLIQIRWPEGVRCIRCGRKGSWLTKRRLLMCPACGFQQSATAGTIFHGARLGLPAWFRTLWWITNQKSGVSALSVPRLMGFGSYRTAWIWLHKLRRAMVRPGRDRLTGRVEVDETYVGGVDTGGGRRHLGNKALVAIAAQVDGEGTGRIRLRRIQDASAESLLPFIQESSEPGATVLTDGWLGYAGVSKKGYKHKSRSLVGDPENASKFLPRVHRVAALLKRWLLGTHQGAVSREHLDYDLDEYTFRFNRRTSKYRGKLFYRLLQQAVAIEPVPYGKLKSRTP